MRYFYVLILFFSIYANPLKAQLTANEIINTSITNSGAFKIANSKITFKFRDKEYAAIRQGGNFKLFRDYVKDSITIDEVLTNDGGIMFDNIILGHSKAHIDLFTEMTFLKESKEEAKLVTKDEKQQRKNYIVEMWNHGGIKEKTEATIMTCIDYFEENPTILAVTVFICVFSVLYLPPHTD